MARRRDKDLVPFVDLGWQTKQVRSEVRKQWSHVLDRSSFVLSPQVETFEKAFAEYSGTAYCIGVANGTDALEIGLRSLGVGAGDEVIVPANSFIASAIAVSRAGCTPVFVDCETGTSLLDTSKIVDAVTDRTRAIMPVHLYGQMANMVEVQSIASERGLAVIEDVAQAQGAAQNGRSAGSIGDVAATSFYPGKNLGAMGDGGAVLTSSAEVMHKSMALRNYGSPVKYEHPVLGFNSRLDSLQAVVLSAKLRRLDAWNQLRRAQAEFYREALGNVDGISLPITADGNEHVWHLFVVRVRNRDRVIAAMNDDGVGTGIHYPRPIPLLGAYEHLGYKSGDFPVSEEYSKTSLSLPIYPGLSRKQQERVIQSIESAVQVRSSFRDSP